MSEQKVSLVGPIVAGIFVAFAGFMFAGMAFGPAGSSAQRATGV